MTATDATVGEPDALCPDCGYDLRGMPADNGRCPECGLAVDLKAPAVSRVPWAHWRQMGPLRAYAKTAALVVLRPRVFVDEVARAAQPGDGRLFRWIALPFVLAPLAFMTVVKPPFDVAVVESAARAVAFGLASFDPWAAPWMYGSQPEAVRIVCLAVGLYAVTGAAGWWLRRVGLTPERRDRAVALAEYACAPLLIAPGVFFVGWAVVSVFPSNSYATMLYLLCGSVLLVLGPLAWWWVQVLLVLRATRSVGRAVAAAGLLPVMWVVIAGVIVFAVPWLIGWVRILAASL